MTTCRIPDCGATTDGFVCKACAAELRRALQNHHRGDPDLPTLMAALSQAATGSARVYRANRRPGEPDEELAELEEAIGWQHDATPAALRSKQGRVTLPATGGVVNLAARGLLDEAWNALTTTVRHLCETRGIEPPQLPTGRAASERVLVEIIRNRWRITREPILAVKAPTQAPRFLADWLADRVNAIRYDEAGPEIHAELTRLRERLIRAVDRAPSKIYAGPCGGKTDNGGTCGRPLYATFNPFRVQTKVDGDQDETDERVVECDGWRPPNDDDYDPTDQGCGATYTAADRRYWLEAELADRLNVIGYWIYWLPRVMHDLPDVPESVMRSWAKEMGPQKRTRLLAHSVNRDGEAMFRGGDVMDLMRRYRPKRFAPRPNRGRLAG